MSGPTGQSALLLAGGVMLLLAVGAPLAARPCDNLRLPDGSFFVFWEQPQTYARTYHVAQQAPNASDDNPGTEAQPWRTIAQAAEALQPGEQVVIHQGVYREWVRPARGGEGATRMIAYEAAPGEEVVLKGSDEWSPAWEAVDNSAQGGPVTWRAALPEAARGDSAFTTLNWPNSAADFPQDAGLWESQNNPRNPVFDLRCGQLFLDGAPLTQVRTPEELLTIEDAFWVEPDNQALQVRLAGSVEPQGLSFEITTRRQVFAPEESYLSYVRVAGLHILHAANGIQVPPPQFGALSVSRGHHWIIEDCEVGWANTCGIEIGGQWWGWVEDGRMLGGHILRRNHIHHCGVNGIGAWHARANQDLLIEDNLIEHCGLLPVMGHCEEAAIKILRATHSLIRRNIIAHTHNSFAIWLDGEIVNTRITQNLIFDTRYSLWGHIGIEASEAPNLIDNNILIGNPGAERAAPGAPPPPMPTNELPSDAQGTEVGIWQNDSSRVMVLLNLVAHGRSAAIYLNQANPNRGGPGVQVPEDNHFIYGNLLTGFDYYVFFPNLTTESDWNVLGGMRPGSERAPFAMRSPYVTAPGEGSYDLTQWHALGRDVHSVEAPLQVSFNEETLELSVTAPPGTGPLRGDPFVSRRLGEWGGLPQEWIQADFLGRPRGNYDEPIALGPLVDLPLDGTPVKVDPRRPGESGQN